MKVQPPTDALAAIDRAVVPEVSKNAMPVGTVAVSQLAPVLKLPEPGAFSQVASCAAAGEPAATSAVEAKSAMGLVLSMQ